MHRALIAPIAAALLILVTAAVAWSTRSTMASDIRADLAQQITRARGQFDDSIKARGFDLMGEAQSFSNSPDVATTFADDPVKNMVKLRTDGYVAVQGFTAALEQRYGWDPEMVLILDRSGNVIVKNGDQNFNQQGDHIARTEPSARTALDQAFAGNVNFDVWNFDGKMVLTSVAPVYGLLANTTATAKGTQAIAERSIIGAVVIGAPLAKEQAEADAKLFHSSVAYFLDEKVQSTYFLDEGREDPTFAKALGGTLFGPDGVAAHALAGGATEPFPCSLGGDDYLGVATRLPDLGHKAGAALLVDISAALAPANHAALAIGVLGALGLLLLLGAEALTGRLFVRGIDEIETGLERLIEGDTEHMFRSRSRDLEGTANALNVLLARLIPGRPEGDEEEESAGSRLAQVAVDEADQVALSQAQGGAPATDAETLRLAQEPEADYFKRLFGEYTAAKKTRGEDVADQTFESFVAKLRLSEGHMKKKYSCRAVRFRVLTRDGQVTLKPVPIY